MGKISLEHKEEVQHPTPTEVHVLTGAAVGGVAGAVAAFPVGILVGGCAGAVVGYGYDCLVGSPEPETTGHSFSIDSE